MHNFALVRACKIFSNFQTSPRHSKESFGKKFGLHKCLCECALQSANAVYPTTILMESSNAHNVHIYGHKNNYFIKKCCIYTKDKYVFATLEFIF